MKLTGGPTDADILKITTAVYNDSTNLKSSYKFFGDDATPVGTPFPFMDTYKFMRTTQLWNGILSSISGVFGVGR